MRRPTPRTSLGSSNSIPCPPHLNGIGQDVLRLRLSPEQRAQWAEAAGRYEAAPDSASCVAFQSINVIIATVPGLNRDSLIAHACRHPGPPTPEDRESERRGTLVSQRTLRSIHPEALVSALQTVTAPVLLLQGDADFIPFSGLLDNARGYANARYLVIPIGGHDLPNDNLRPVFEAMETFLAGEWPPEASHSGSDLRNPLPTGARSSATAVPR